MAARPIGIEHAYLHHNSLAVEPNITRRGYTCAIPQSTSALIPVAAHSSPKTPSRYLHDPRFRSSNVSNPPALWFLGIRSYAEFPVSPLDCTVTETYGGQGAGIQPALRRRKLTSAPGSLPDCSRYRRHANVPTF